MKRRNFIKQALLATGGVVAAPYILPSGRLFAQTGQRLANHVVVALFAGGLRNLESVHQQDGNLMPNILSGNNPINAQIAPGIKTLPSLGLGYSLQSKGTLFKEFRYKEGPTGHFNGHTVAVTGNYTNTGLNLRAYPQSPTIFEYYRKHNSPANSALNSWWVSDALGSYPYLEYSQHPDYGPKYAANYIAPRFLFGQSGYDSFANPLSLSPNQVDKIEEIRRFMNGNFGKEIQELGFTNDYNDKKSLKQFFLQVINATQNGQLPMPLAQNLINGDALNIIYALEVIKEYKPELLVVNMTNIDVCHQNYTAYADNIYRADYMVGHLWKTIQSTPGMADDTILIVVPEHGRNAQPNNIKDNYGRFGLDHTNDDSSREIFCLLIGPQNKEVVKYNQIISGTLGESIDVVPTVAHILGFYDSIPKNLLPGRPLYEAFK